MKVLTNQRLWQLKQKEKGNCVCCGEKAIPGTVNCFFCRHKRIIYNRKRNNHLPWHPDRRGAMPKYLKDMKRKDYEVLAQTLNDIMKRRPDDFPIVQDMVLTIAEDLGRTYSNFNREKFLEKSFKK